MPLVENLDKKQWKTFNLDKKQWKNMRVIPERHRRFVFELVKTKLPEGVINNGA